MFGNALRGVLIFNVTHMPGAPSNQLNENPMTAIDPGVQIGDLAVRVPAAARVLIGRGIDFCCSGPRTLACASRDHFLEPMQIVEEIRSELKSDAKIAAPDGTSVGIVQSIVDGFLLPLGHKLSAIEALLDKIVYFHSRGKDRDFRYLQAAFLNLSGKLWEHRFQKEQVWFPTIITGNPLHSRLSFQAMQRENKVVAEYIEKVQSLHTALAARPHKCVSVCALDTALRTFLNECTEQIRLESEVLCSAAAPKFESTREPSGLMRNRQ